MTNWWLGFILSWVPIGIFGHAVWSFRSMPDDQFVSDQRRADKLAPGYVVKGSRYGLFSALRCPNWEAASFRLVSQAPGNEAPRDIIMCCTAEAEPVCQLASLPPKP